jgi:hypothetical protein
VHVATPCAYPSSQGGVTSPSHLVKYLLQEPWVEWCIPRLDTCFASTLIWANVRLIGFGNHGGHLVTDVRCQLKGNRKPRADHVITRLSTSFCSTCGSHYCKQHRLLPGCEATCILMKGTASSIVLFLLILSAWMHHTSRTVLFICGYCDVTCFELQLHCLPSCPAEL